MTKRFYFNLLGVLLLVVCTSAATIKYFDVSKNLEIFTSLYKELNLYYVDETNPGDVMKTGIDAMLESLDPYTVYYPESKIEDVRFMHTGQYGGVGIFTEIVDDQVVISEVLEGYPAEKNGLREGDLIKKIDGQEIDGLDQDQLNALIKGSVGSEIELEYERMGEIIPLVMERAEIKIKEVPYFGMLNETDGYIKLTSFTRTASMSVRSALKKLKDKEGATRLILDLRGNGGGLLREAVNIVNMFVPKGELIVSTKGKVESWNKVYEATVAPLAPEMPLIVLIDEKSASASEIVSGALQDLDRAVIVGKRSFGKGLVQQTKDLAYNARMKLTIAKYYIPSGRCIQKLDYSNKKDGVANAVADSLIKPFKTKNGRTVYDGRGVDPDVVVSKGELSQFTTSLKTNQIIFNYVTQYIQKNEQPDTVINFDYSDYSSFKGFVMSEEFEYSSETYNKFSELLEAAKKESYFTDAETQFGLLESELIPSKENDLIRFEEEITELIEQEIVRRYFFRTGEIQFGLMDDPYIHNSVNTFNTNYTSLLE